VPRFEEVVTIKIPINVKGDLYGGVTAAIITLPLALALGVASGLGASAGLYGAIIVCMCSALFRSSPGQISGPTGPLALVVASIAALYLGNPAVVFVIIALSGVFQILFGLVRAGVLMNLVPAPVITGFISGIGVMLIVLQLNPLFGLPVQSSIINSLTSLMANVGNISTECVILSGVALIIVCFTPKKISNVIPASLLALIFCTAGSVMFKTDVPIIGVIPTGLPEIKIGLIPPEMLLTIIPIAFALALLSSIDSLMTVLIADNMLKIKSKYNRELVGQGVGNILSGTFGGTVAAVSTTPTVVNVKMGATSSLSGIIHCLILISVIIFLAPTAQVIPLAVLAGILIRVGFDMIDFNYIKNIPNAPRIDVIVMVTVLLMTIFGNLIVAIFLGCGLHALIHRFAKTKMQAS
jgi:SulP family sulfate permease